MSELARHKLNGVSFLRREGSGEALPLVMLHGIGSNAESFSGLVDALPAEWDLICWDAPGYGGSDHLAQQLPTASDYAGRLESLVNALGLSQFYLLGHSLGALFAVSYAASHPGEVKALILLAPAEGYGMPEGGKLPEKAQKRLDNLQRLGPAQFASERAPNLVFQPENNLATVASVQTTMAAINFEGYAQAVHALSAGTLGRSARDVALPSLVLVGEGDRVTPFEQGEGAHRGLVQRAPNLQHTIKQVAGAGHALPQQKAHEVAAAIMEFVDQRQKQNTISGQQRPAGGENRMSYNVPPVQRAFKLLRHIADGNDCGNTSQAAKAVGINRTTLLRLLHTLAMEGMIEADGPGGGYRLGTGLISLASSAVFSRDLVQVAQPVLKRLAQGLGLSAHLGILEGQHIVYLVRETPNLHLVSNVRVGSRLPAHATTIGRSILAELDFTDVKSLFTESELVGVTAKTPVTYTTLAAQLADDKSQGMAWSVGNFEANIGSCAAAIFDVSGEVAGAINVTGPDHHFLVEGGRRDEIARDLTAAAEQISRQLGYLPPRLAGENNLTVDKGGRVS